METKDQFLRIKQLASYPARPAKVHTYKSGENAGQKKQINAKSASQGIIAVTEKTIWQWVRQGKFPKPIKLSENVTVWRWSEVAAWLESKAT